jgi:hypothetical protein
MPATGNAHGRGNEAGTIDAVPTGMLDLVLVLATAAFFGLSWAYARFCEGLE